MMQPPLRILHLEDNAADAALIQDMLETDGIVCDVTRVDTRADFFAAVERGGFDLILTDYTLPSFDGLSALKIAMEKCPEVPFIFVSGTLGEEVAIEALKIGATDYILKQRLSRIAPSVHRALREARERGDRKRAEALLAEEKRMLEMIAKGTSLSTVLDALCRLVEELSEGSLASILLLDADGARLRHGGAPSLPKSYTDAIDGGFIGPAAGSCGTAAYRKEPVIVSDIATDPLWANYRDLALPHGLRACWSTPVLASDGRVLGTFAIYSHEPRSPTSQQLDIIEQITDLASIAMERKRAEEERQVYLWFLESMDQVNRAIQGTNDLEQMMSDVLDAVLSIFDCDRSWLVYPCDPDAVSWKVPMEHARPEFPGAFALGLDLPMDSEVATVFRTVRASSSPVRFGPESEHPLPADTAKRFSIQSAIAMAIYPKGDKPYMLGLHQCSHPRIWKPEEERLFQEIGRRLEDALTSLLMLRNLRQSERYMRRSEAYLTEAQRLSHTGSWAWNVSTGEVLWSREIYRIFGLPPEQTSLNIDLIKKLRHPEDRALAEQTLEGALRERRDFEFESRIVLPDGSIRHVRSVGHPVVNDAGVLVEFVGAVMDVTEGKTREEALRKSQADLAHVTRMATLGEMTASIAHEVNQPLAGAITSASACLRWLDAQKLEEARRSASRTIAEGHRASEIIGRIRALAKKAPPQKDWLDVNEMIHEVIALARSEIQRNGVALETQLSDDVPVMLADRIQLQQVILNLMMNAIEAMNGVGEGPRELLVRSGTDESKHIVISVHDSGPGINPQSLEHLFEAFYTTKPQGLGMGLAISRSIIDAHGGRLWVTANAPRGAVFQFILPVENAKVV